MLDKIITWIKRMMGFADLNKDGTVNGEDAKLAREKVNINMMKHLIFLWSNRYVYL